jgi:diguanylate cyclase (GGDEF)-like protein/PAS domain S-box-containing protein
MQSRRLIFRYGVVSASFVVLYLLLNLPEVLLLSRLGFVAWYPAIGLVMALLLGVSPWFAVVAALADILAAQVIYHQPIISFSNVGALGIASCYGAAAYMLRGPMQIDLGLRRRQDVVRYVFVSAIAAALATCGGVGGLIADHSITRAEFRSSATGWFLGDVIGLIGIAPFFLVHVFPYVRQWLAPPTQPTSSRGDASAPVVTVGGLVETICQGLTMLGVLWVIFGTEDGRYDHFYLCFVPIIWIAMRQGVRRAVTGLLLLNCGIITAMHFFPPTTALFNKVAVLMLVLSAVGLLVGSEVSERERMKSDLTEQKAYLGSLIENSPMGIVVLDHEGSVQIVNSAFERLFQYKRQELFSFDIGRMGISDEQSTDQLIPEIFAGNSLRRTVRRRRKDGQILDVALHGVPLVTNSEVRGAYLIYEDVSDETRSNQEHLEHEESLKQLVKELDLRTKQMTSLNEMGALLASSANVEEACGVIAIAARELFPDGISGAVYLFRSSRDLIEAAARWGVSNSLAPTFPPEACWSLRRGQPHWSGPSGSGVPCQHLTRSESIDSLCVPMVAQGNTSGILHLEFESPAEPRSEVGKGSFLESHQRLAISAASQIALSVASLQLRETLREQSIRDPLTRLFNRRFLEESFERELQLAGRKKQNVAVLFLDLDHFKGFNDTYGHDAGDMVLRALADLFRNFFRTTDICCRYGGEEFAILLPDSSAQDAADRANALRSEVKGLRLQYKKQSLGQLSVSVGVAAFPEHGKSSGELLKIADLCLYESKTRGRDMVTVASPQNDGPMQYSR